MYDSNLMNYHKKSPKALCFRAFLLLFDVLSVWFSKKCAIFAHVEWPVPFVYVVKFNLIN